MLITVLCPSRGPHAAQLSFGCSISSLHTDNMCPYFDNLQFNIFEAVVLSVTLSRLYCLL